MGGELIGLVAVILGMGVPLGALYTYYRVRKLRSEERLAAIARGVDIPMEPELNQAARSAAPESCWSAEPSATSLLSD